MWNSVFTVSHERLKRKLLDGMATRSKSDLPLHQLKGKRIVNCANSLLSLWVLLGRMSRFSRERMPDRSGFWSKGWRLKTFRLDYSFWWIKNCSDFSCKGADWSWCALSNRVLRNRIHFLGLVYKPRGHFYNAQPNEILNWSWSHPGMLKNFL